MPEKKEKFIAILRIELDDLYQDIQQLIALCEKNYSSGQYSDNVFLQNLATFKNELLGINTFKHILDTTKLEEFDDMQTMVEEIRQRFHQAIDVHGLVPAIKILVDRKLDKVARYVMQDRS